jgi:hypothetical protein
MFRWLADWLFNDTVLPAKVMISQMELGKVVVTGEG